MEKQYSISQKGTAYVRRKGLYYQITCVCDNPERVILIHEGGTRDLGICVPDGMVWRLTTKIPIKYLAGESWQFKVHDDETEFIPIREDMPFEHLPFIRDSKLTCRDGEMGLQIPISNPTGQWSEPNTSE